MAKTAQEITALSPLGQMQHWTRMLGTVQQMLLERAGRMMEEAGSRPAEAMAALSPNVEEIARIQADMAEKGVALWERFLTQTTGQGEESAAPLPSAADRDRRFADPRWRDNPLFDLVRQVYLLAAEGLTRLSDAVDGLDPLQKEKLRFATRRFVEAASPSNFPFTN
ncbi:MAG TPA: class I poly(R)-hydroxyalkanoic acid synthase, partial [Sphingobium sp.]|nr:class I poly(R)-hydroxyalkanoic acid synthase [Sphingobium sp.]